MNGGDLDARMEALWNEMKTWPEGDGTNRNVSDIDQYRELARGIFREIRESGTATLTAAKLAARPWRYSEDDGEVTGVEVLASLVRQEDFERKERECTRRKRGRPADQNDERDAWVRRFVQWLQESGLKREVAIQCVIKDSGLKERTVRRICPGK